LKDDYLVGLTAALSESQLADQMELTTVAYAASYLEHCWDIGLEKSKVVAKALQMGVRAVEVMEQRLDYL